MVRTPVVSLANLFKTGIIVDDVEGAKTEYSDLMGVTWGPEAEIDMPVWVPDGSRTVSFKYAYTAEGPHHLELVRRVPGTLWNVNDIGHVHHLGYWCRDIVAASEELTRRGLPLRGKIGVSRPDAPARVVIHQATTGLYLELLDVGVRAELFGGRR